MLSKRSAGVLAYVGIFYCIQAQPMPTVSKNGTAINGSAHFVGSPSEFMPDKVISPTAGPAVPIYGKVHQQNYQLNYDSVASAASFPPATCQGYPYGYYGNIAHECRIFHVCQEDGRLETFDCPPYTKFNNYLLICDWPHKVNANCEPAYKEEDYPPQSQNPVYHADHSYFANLLSPYPASKPIYQAQISYQNQPLYPLRTDEPTVRSDYTIPPVQYEPRKFYEQEPPVKDPLYPLGEKTEKYDTKPMYNAASLLTDVNKYDQVISTPIMYPLGEKPLPVYSLEKSTYPVYREDVISQKQVYDQAVPNLAYPLGEKTAPLPYPLEKVSYSYPRYPVEVKANYGEYLPPVSDYMDQKIAYPAKPLYPENYAVYPVASKSPYPMYPQQRLPYEDSSYYPFGKPYAAYEMNAVKPMVQYPLPKPGYNTYPVDEIYPKPLTYPAYPLGKLSYKQHGLLTATYPPANYRTEYRSNYNLPFPVPLYGHKSYAKASYSDPIKSYNSYANRNGKAMYQVSTNVNGQYRSRLHSYLRGLSV